MLSDYDNDEIVSALRALVPGVAITVGREEDGTVAIALEAGAVVPSDADIEAAAAQIRLDRTKLDGKRRVVARADQLGEVIAGLAPNFEKHSWPDKRAAAAAVAAGLTVADEPRIAILEAERQVTGETLADLAAKILANVDLANPANYYAAVGLIAGQRRMTLAAIDALADPATVKEDIAAVMAAAEAEAQALLASLLA